MTRGPYRDLRPIPRAPILPVTPERPAPWLLASAVASLLGLSAGALAIVGYLVALVLGWAE